MALGDVDGLALHLDAVGPLGRPGEKPVIRTRIGVVTSRGISPAVAIGEYVVGQPTRTSASSSG